MMSEACEMSFFVIRDASLNDIKKRERGRERNNNKKVKSTSSIDDDGDVHV